MPKTPKKPTPLRQVQRETGMTQKQFARFLGIKYDRYQSYSIGRVPIPREVAMRILRCTGADPDSITNPKGRVALRMDCSAPYTAADFAAWKKHSVAATMTPDGQAKQIASWVAVLFEAAHKHGKLTQVFDSLTETLTELRRDFGLERTSDALLADRRLVHRWTLSVGFLRKHPTIAAMMKYKDEPWHKDDEKITREVAFALQWNPGGAVPPRP